MPSAVTLYDDGIKCVRKWQQSGALETAMASANYFQR